MLVRLRRAADALINLAALVGGGGLVIVTVVILVDVVGRVFGAPLRGAQDITMMTMSILVFGGMALCDRLGGHIAVDVFERYFPPAMIRAGDVVAALLGAAIFIGIAWTVWESARLSQLLNLRTNIIGWPKAWFQWAICIFSAITALGMLLRSVELLLGGPAPPHPVAGGEVE